MSYGANGSLDVEISEALLNILGDPGVNAHSQQKRTFEELECEDQNASASEKYGQGLQLVFDVEEDDSDIEDAKELQRLIRPIYTAADVVTAFPRGTTHMLNSGDFCGYASFVQKYLDPQCEITSNLSNVKVNGMGMVKVFELTNEAHPDRVLTVDCIHQSSRMVIADMKSKFTTCLPVYNGVAEKVTDPAIRDLFPSRAETLRRRLRTLLKKEKQRDAIEKILESDVDIVVHGIVRMILTLDNTCRKVNNVLLLCDFTSVYVARNQFTAESSATQQS